jgi:hypothetical protein
VNTDQDRQRADQSKQHDHAGLAGAESPRELLAVHDPSKQAAPSGRQAVGRGHGVTVQWVRPTELAARIAARTTAGAVAAHVAAHHQVRENVRARLAPLSAFGRQSQSGPVTVERSVVGR